ncbi:MAG: radical SAM family heme chaperone HemW [Pseudoflavonifractor sp.]|nr:radical SAM family heme chaperone HemW [Pseudoflavonifractor sp.]
MAGLYIHIPFCKSKCDYCDFYSIPDPTRVSEYVSAVIAEAAMRSREIDQPFTTMYIGGGTPSTLPHAEIGRLIDALAVPTMTEITIEVNPDDVTPDFAHMIARTGINRVSMGFQSMIDEELKMIGRRHTAAQSIMAVERLREAGITNISGDIIYGLPLQTADSWRRTLDIVMPLGLPHMSAYSLTYEPGTRLTVMLMAGKVKETDEETVAAMYDELCRVTADAGYCHYEISNFSHPDMESRHNSSYWHYIPYLGLGCAAHSFDGKIRRYNPTNIREYLSSIGSGHTCHQEETETALDLYNDYIITSLRTANGINLGDMSRRFDTATLTKSAQRFIQQGLLISDGQNIRFTEKAWLVSDAVLRELIIV